MTEDNQIRLKTLLKDDDTFRAWILKKPVLKTFHTTPPWRFMMQKERGGRWYKKDFPSYREALAMVKLKLPDAWDMTIHCKPQAFNPPVVKVDGKKIWNPVPEGHRWCVFCRRATIFRCFNHHPNSRYQLPAEEERCLICGARAEPMRVYRSPELWPLHVELPTSNKAS